MRPGDMQGSTRAHRRQDQIDGSERHVSYRVSAFEPKRNLHFRRPNPEMTRPFSGLEPRGETY